MTRVKVVFFCTECGNESPRWQGQCSACGAWNTLTEAPRSRGAARARSGGPFPRGAVAGVPPLGTPVSLAEIATGEQARWGSGIEELDFVLGGGIVPGSIVLLGGEPGIGKSTLLLQLAGRLAADRRAVLYVSGEESAEQVRMRADRVVGDAGGVFFLAETDLQAILDAALSPDTLERSVPGDGERSGGAPAVLIVDSIQTVYAPELEGTAGSVNQVRECAARFQRFAKETGTVVFLVGHVTKDGSVAGPRTLEHIVDTVLYFEAAGGLDHRLLRATKNRFGAVDEMGVFHMTAQGLAPVPNPSELFLGSRVADVSGSAVVPTIEGTRPLLVEVQALCTKASYGAPQRAATGLDRQRLALLLAVLEKRAGLPFGALDVFVNVVGGVRISEPAADLATAAALVSSVADRPVPARAVFLGEVGLGGEVRVVDRVERRLAEAARLGFERVYLGGAGGSGSGSGMGTAGPIEIVRVRDVRELVAALFPER